MSESLRNDGRVWVPKNPIDKKPPQQIPEALRDYFLEETARCRFPQCQRAV
jgi:succinate dehydrogenase / fumarate reductase flavoprotein subunit